MVDQLVPTPRAAFLPGGGAGCVRLQRRVAASVVGHVGRVAAKSVAPDAALPRLSRLSSATFTPRRASVQRSNVNHMQCKAHR